MEVGFADFILRSFITERFISEIGPGNLYLSKVTVLLNVYSFFLLEALTV